MAALDFVLVGAALAAAVAFLVWQLGIRKKKPACHPPSSSDDEPEVVLGASLRKGLERAQRK